MSLIIRIDVDRPYGRRPFVRHFLSRMSSDIGAPKLPQFGYLHELILILDILAKADARSYVFVRRCTLPSPEVLRLLSDGRHEVGLHLENSRTFQTFTAERVSLEAHIGRPVTAFSKHGSGGRRFGRSHYAPYEPEKYAEWGREAGMRFFSGNLENPAIHAYQSGGLAVFPSAFWLEPAWRDTGAFTIDWLLARASTADVVLLVHPENVLESSELTDQFKTLVNNVPTRILA